MTSRRTFLKASSLLAASSTLGFRLFGQSAAAATATDYKALVCFFLYGGSDCANTLIPFEPSAHAAYLALRGGASGIGVPRSRLQNTALDTTLALNPGLAKTAALYRRGDAAVLANVGPLLEPTKKDASGALVRVANPAEFASLPDKLRSHNDQQATWQSFAVEGGSRIGWGGRLCDRFAGSNASNPVLSSISPFGANVFGSGQSTVNYQVSTSGPLAFRSLGAPKLFGSSVAPGIAEELLTRSLPSGNDLANDLGVLRKRSIEVEKVLSAQLATVSASFAPTSFLEAQVAMVSRAIQAGRNLGLKRQVFLVGLGGFDHHDNLYGYDSVANKPLEGTHEDLLGQVDGALAAMYNESVALGLANNITSFTMSDFGRTLTSNGDGSDHGWGSHHLVVGGAVAGNKVYGTMPDPDPTDPAWVDQRGVLLPTTSVDQVANTLARWFGVPIAERSLVTPNIGSFTAALGMPQVLGFLG